MTSASCIRELSYMSKCIINPRPRHTSHPRVCFKHFPGDLKPRPRTDAVTARIIMSVVMSRSSYYSATHIFRSQSVRQTVRQSVSPSFSRQSVRPSCSLTHSFPSILTYSLLPPSFPLSPRSLPLPRKCILEY